MTCYVIPISHMFVEQCGLPSIKSKSLFFEKSNPNLTIFFLLGLFLIIKTGPKQKYIHVIVKRQKRKERPNVRDVPVNKEWERCLVSKGMPGQRPNDKGKETNE